MTIYRQKTIEFEARQWDGTATEAELLIDWMKAGGATARYYQHMAGHAGQPVIWIEVPEQGWWVEPKQPNEAACGYAVEKYVREWPLDASNEIRLVTARLLTAPIAASTAVTSTEPQEWVAYG